jgi:hypothetical protein
MLKFLNVMSLIAGGVFVTTSIAGLYEILAIPGCQVFSAMAIGFSGGIGLMYIMSGLIGLFRKTHEHC